MGEEMEQEKRNGQSPIPPNLESMINPDQLMTLRQIENFGWQVAFVRRPSFHENIVVVSGTDAQKFGVLEDTGELNLQAEIKIRRSQSQPTLKTQRG